MLKLHLNDLIMYRVLTKLSFHDSRVAYNNLSGQIPASLFQVAHYKYVEIFLFFRKLNFLNVL
jgi:hypothetical protein